MNVLGFGTWFTRSVAIFLYGRFYTVILFLLSLAPRCEKGYANQSSYLCLGMLQDLLECECSIQTVNRRVQRRLMELFPGAPALPRGGLTVLTVSQRTHNCMSNWSDAVAEEREDAIERVCLSSVFSTP